MKRRFRRKRGWLSLGISLVLIAAVLFMAKLFPSVNRELPAALVSTQVLASLIDRPTEVVMHRVYACGEESQALGKLSNRELKDLLDRHPDWSVDKSNPQKLVITENINDLSPACKKSAYFGLDENGNLTLFDGTPSHKHAIRTFFQLNIKHLKSSLPSGTVDQLYAGIRIKDYAEFNSVLSTFSDYAVEENPPY